MNSATESLVLPGRAQVRHINSPRKQENMKKAAKRRANVSRKSCEDKVRFRDREEAKKALRRARNARVIELELHGSSKRGESRAYPCPNCLGYHLASADRFADTNANRSQRAA